MEAGILDDETDDRFTAEAKRAVNEATEQVEAAPHPDTAGFHAHVYAESTGGPS